MDNYEIAHNFSMLAKLMDIHGENSFKSKSYSIAAYNIEKLTVQLSDLPKHKIFSIQGIGDAIGKKITELLQTGKLNSLQKTFRKNSTRRFGNVADKRHWAKKNLCYIEGNGTRKYW